MSLKYYNAYSGIRSKTSRDKYRADHNAMQDMGFENAPNVYYGYDKDCVEYEYEYGSNEFRPITMVRVDEVVGYNTGMFDSNDFKIFIFRHDFVEADNLVIGNKFRWKDNIWLVINASTLNGIVNSVEVRRCNNVARFYDNFGNEIYEPCIMDIVLRFTRNMTTAPIVESNGEQRLWIQRNKNTSYIDANTRFLFGTPDSRKAWKVYASGEKNYLNTKTFDDNSPSLNEYYMTFDTIDIQRDDLERGFADARIPKFTIRGNDIAGDYRVGDAVSLDFSVYRGQAVTNKALVYNVDNEHRASIIDNKLIMNENGVVNITVAMADNLSISKQFRVNVVDNPTEEYQIKLTPHVSYILQGNTVIFKCGLFRNGVLDSDTLDFDIKDISLGIPRENYEIKIIDFNTFSIQNKGMFLKYPLKILCTSGNYSQEFNFELRGVY